jgi:hypothetical protein
MTHAAMSSARVMATCAVMGEAVGTAANIAREFGLTPDGVYEEKIKLLQTRLTDNGCFLPHIRRDMTVAHAASLSADGEVKGIENLRNGADRNNHTYGTEDEGAFVSAGTTLKYEFAPRTVENIHIAFDSDLDRVTLPGDKCERRHSMRANVFPDSPVMHLPLTLVKEYEIYVTDADGNRVLLARDNENRKQTLNFAPDFPISAIELKLGADYGGNADIHVFSFDFR